MSLFEDRSRRHATYDRIEVSGGRERSAQWLTATDWRGSGPKLGGGVTGQSSEIYVGTQARKRVAGVISFDKQQRDQLHI